MTGSTAAGSASGPLLLADISGYMGFLQDVSKVEGDAVFAYASDTDDVPRGGSYVVQAIGGSRELAGPEVVMAHRLLKNHAAELIGHTAYALITEVAASRLAVPVGDAREVIETYEHYPPISARVYPLR
jgi:hypothetical protein